MIHSATGEFKEGDGKKNLVLDSIEKYEEVFLGIKKEMVEKSYFMKKTDVNADDVPLYKPLKFQTLLIVIRCFFQIDNKLEPQAYLDECLYEI